MKKLLGKQGGFTLVELLVVVGIIVGLAAVIVPTVTKFASKGDEGAKAAETENVQAAMDALMADANISSLSAQTTGTNTFTALPVATPAIQVLVSGTPTAVQLDDYLRSDTTKYCYTWDDSGKITLVACP